MLGIVVIVCLTFLMATSIEFLFSSMRMRVLGMSLSNLAKDIRLLDPKDELTKKMSSLIETVADDMEDRFLAETFMGRWILRKKKQRKARAIHEAADRILKEASDGK